MALHRIPHGEVWPVSEIKKRKKEIEKHGLSWSVVESVPVHENIKTHQGDFKEHIENYKQTILNLGECGIDKICYNFMPVLDWTRTDLDYEMEDGSTELNSETMAFAAFEIFLLKRPTAEENHSEEEIKKAKDYADVFYRKKQALINNIIAGFPAAQEGYCL